ncbi:hypothetical protein RHMOL_Rhmol11G0029900 [Rhododendron molle]|uniref:Uncharacterized protein n=1 Tax=Rhododendron molle TaxID=49168 RepID=A0ACC0LN01_RHOML|nr:hypothetical protein RHMOL_Rhmol11G0029900 [Rhododendron molle]
MVPEGGTEMEHYDQFRSHLKGKVLETDQEEEQMLWAYEVLRMYRPKNKRPDMRTLPSAMIWGPLHRGNKKAMGNLLAYRVYLDDLSGS